MGIENTNISVFKDLFKTKEVPYNVPISKIFARIKAGTSKDIITKIRTANDKKEADLIKQKLPCILFGGVFKERNKDGLITHSGLMVVDFDKYESNDIMYDHLHILKQNKHFVSLFISPSGKGVKGVVLIPISDKFTHEKYFKEFNKKFQYDYFDNSNCNVDRVCYESFDPEIYINYKATIFEPRIFDSGFDVKDKVPLLPINDENQIIEKIMSFNWTKDFVDGERNSFIFDLGSAFCEYGISESFAIGYIQNNVAYGDFTEMECKNAVKSAYKRRSFNSKYFENYQMIDRIKSDLKKGKTKVIEKFKISEDTYNEIKDVAEIDDFWYINDKEKISVNPLKYKYFLERNGFKKHFPNDADKPQFVVIDSNKVRLTSTSKIKDFVLDYLMERKEINVWNYCANYQNLFSEQFLLMLESIDLFMLNDTRDISFISFENGILKVTKDKIELIDYIDVDGYIWESSILKRQFIHYDNFENDYKKFINNISGKDPFAIECTIGYLLSTYKNRSNNKAVILNDELISSNPEGGTGKGLLVQGISQIRNTCIIDGKQFDGKKSFAYQTVSLDTKIIVFDDIKKDFSLEDKFSLITEGITLERKNKDAVKLNVHESPKIVISTNYAVKGEGNSHDRRRHEIEISQYYGADLTPDEDFGRQLFDEWENIDFEKFDNYMVFCLQSFLKNGLIKQTAKNLKLRKLIAETNMDFYDWISDIQNFPINYRNDKEQFFTLFIKDNPDFGKWLKRNTFNGWIQKYANYKDYRFEQNSSNGQKWYGIFEKNVENIIDENEIDF
jgi:hypothetical protein